MNKYNNLNHTFLIIKPDIVAKGCSYELDIANFIAQHKFTICKLTRTTMTESQAAEMYSHLVDKPFYSDIKDFMCQELVCTIWYHPQNAIKRMIEITGATDPAEANVGTVRDIFGTDKMRNAVHRSDSLESVIKEIQIFKDAFKI